MFFNSHRSFDGSETNECGLTASHAYTVLKAIQLTSGERLVKVRNPVGKETYSCAFGDESPLWTLEKRIEAGATSEAVNEGIFFMTVEDYMKQGVATIISYDTEGWYSDHFLMLGDARKKNGSWTWCGSTCTRHHIKVTSDVDQTGYLTVHTWEPRSQPYECRKRHKLHSIYRMGDFTVDMFRDGAKQMRPQQYKAGKSYTYILEFDWSREDVTPDWSVTVYAENGPVHVKHYDNIESDVLPNIEKQLDWEGRVQDIKEDRSTANLRNRYQPHGWRRFWQMRKYQDLEPEPEPIPEPEPEPVKIDLQ